MKKINLEAELKKLTYSKGTDALKMEITPYRDWRIVVIVFFVGLIASFSFNLYISININRESFFDVPMRSGGVTKFDEEGLAKTITTMDEKAIRYEAAKNGPMTLVDPSL